MTEMTPLNTIRARQRAWAERNGRALDKDGYCTCADDNIFERLSDAARKDFDRADGGELGRQGKRGKIRAVHSSSALACNVFDYWRQRDLEPLSRAFGVSRPFRELALEQKLSTGVGSKANLDVLLTADDGSLFAIESKFAESYSKSKLKTFLKPKYFHNKRGLWAAAGLPGCQVVVEQLPAKAGRLQFRLKVGLRLKPPEAAPAEEPAQGSVGAVTLNPSSSWSHF